MRTDFNSDAFQGFDAALGFGPDDDAIVDYRARCLAVEGDDFMFSGTTPACGDRLIYMHIKKNMCLPTSCTSNETDISLMIPMLTLNADEGRRAPPGSYTYEGLGDETWDGSLSCLFDRWENKYTLREFDDMVFTEERRDDCIQYFLSLKDASWTTQDSRLYAKRMA